MPTLPDEATVAYQEALARAAAAAAADRKALRQAALDALRAILHYTKADGTTVSFTISDLAITAVHTDLANGLVVVAGGGVHLAVRRQNDGDWIVRVVQLIDGGWTPVSGRVRDLAEVGAALLTEGDA